MAYTRTDWVSGGTPLSADNMNNIEDGIEELNSKFGGLNVVKYQTTITIPSGTSSSVQTKVVDTSSVIPTGREVFGVICSIGGYPLPYPRSSDGVIGTWVERFYSDGRVEIKNRGGAWNNYTLNCVIFYS